ncbi:MAG: hypothetical protein HYT07_01740 [Candidatus Levybacteria bacterium]|nr:hypothetical protein [Candidatus Levybacteria bacterium]
MIESLSKKHIFYYLALILILILGFLLAYINSSNRQIQILAVVFTAISYVFWGILHHLFNHDLSMKIMVEYVLIGSLGLAIILILL